MTCMFYIHTLKNPFEEDEKCGKSNCIRAGEVSIAWWTVGHAHTGPGWADQWTSEVKMHQVHVNIFMLYILLQLFGLRVERIMHVSNLRNSCRTT